MCTCIAEIKQTYTVVNREASRVARKSFTKPVQLVSKDNFDIDAFLDAINIITKDLNQVTQYTNELIALVRNNFCYIKLQSMPDNIIRDSNERFIQTPKYRIVKLRISNSAQKLSKANGFRLVYMVFCNSLAELSTTASLTIE